MDPQDFYLIDRDLAVYSAKMLLRDEERLPAGMQKGSVVGESGAKSLPITPDGQLRPGVLYESSTDPDVRYYLPEYRLHVDGGRYTTRLKWRSPEDDPNGPLAFLTVEVVAVVPPAGGVPLLEIPHQAVARIAYEMPIGGDADQGGAATQSTGGEQPVLWLEVGALQPLSENVRRCRLPILDKGSFDRLYEILTEEKHNARLQIRYFATAGRRTWRHAVVGTIDLNLQKAILEEKNVFLTAVTPSVSPIANQVIVDPIKSNLITVIPPPVDTGMINTDIANVLSNPGTFTTLRPAGEFNLEDAAESEADKAGTTVVAPLALQTVLNQDFAQPVQKVLPESDLKVYDNGMLKSAIPVQAMLNDRGKPTLLEVPVEGVQWIRPFHFSIETNAYMFDIPEDMRPTTNHLLLEVDILADDGQVLGTFYQDSAFRDRFYYQPQEFRLPRQAAYPYLPALRLTFLDLFTQENADDPNQAGHTYRVRIAYQLVPFIDPGVLARARQQAPSPNPRFTALVPLSSTLALRIPDDKGGELIEIPRTGTEVDFDQGILDEIDLSKAQFERLQLIAGGGMEGTVKANLQGNQDARIPVKLSLIHNAGQVFNYLYHSDQGEGKHRIAITNRIESSVTVEQLYQVPLGNGAAAQPLTAAGFQVKPGETATLDYQVRPANSDVSNLRPLLSTSIVLTNLKDLWTQLIVNSGYTSDTFKISITTDPQYFGPLGDGSPQLEGLRVSFGDGASAILTKEQPKVQDVELRMPFLYSLLGDPEALNYEYWVTNLYADGTQTEGPLCTDQGDLQVKPVGAP